MTSYVVLLRGVNVGGKNILPMKELAARLEANGFSTVRTTIQSGNIVLKSKSNPANSIAALILSEFGFKPSVMVLKEKEFNQALDSNPFIDAAGKELHFYFCSKPPSVDTERLNSLSIASEQWRLIGSVLYLYAPDGVGRSKLAAKIEGCLGVPATARNLNTINKLAAMLKA